MTSWMRALAVWIEESHGVRDVLQKIYRNWLWMRGHWGDQEKMMHNVDKSGGMALSSLACSIERSRETWKEKWMLVTWGVRFVSYLWWNSAAERSQLDFSGAVELEKKRSHVKVRAGQSEGKLAGLREEAEAETQKRKFHDDHHFLSNRCQSGQGRGEWEHGACPKNASLIQTWGSSAGPPAPGLAGWGQWPSDTTRAK